VAVAIASGAAETLGRPLDLMTEAWLDDSVERRTLMSRTARRTVMGVLSALAVVVGGAGLAWACTPSAYIFLSATGGSSGTTINVKGKEFAPGPVEIQWNGVPEAQPTVANGPNFSVPVAVPDVEPGVYYLQATAVDDFGGIEGQATRAFKVSVPAGERAPARTEARPEPQPDGAPAPGGRAETRSRQAPGRVAPLAPDPAGPIATAPEAAAAEPAASAPVTPIAGERGNAAAQSPGSSPRTPSQQSAAGDLWSGFASGPNQSLLPKATTATSASGSDPRFALGMAFLGAGLVTLLGGFLLLGLRRRRVSAPR